MAFGGVPTGKMNEQDADIPTAKIKISFGIFKDAPSSIGINIPVNPVLLIKFVKITVIAVIKIKI